jgi:GNAT superfamily N-acetyltransferase
MPRPARFEVVPFRPTHLAGALGLQKRLWSPDPSRNRQVFRWKYEQNPYQPSPLIWVGVDGQRVVGMLGFQGARWQLGQPTRTLNIPHAGDLVIAPDHRQSGLHRTLDDAAAKHLHQTGFPAAVNLSASTMARIARVFNGWIPQTIDRAICPAATGRWAEAQRRLRRALYSNSRTSGGRWVPLAARVLLRRQMALPRHRPSWSDEIQEAWEPPAKQMADLIDDLGHDGRIRHVRNAEYLSWRYRNPLSDYLFLTWRASRGIDGFIVLRAARSRLETAVWIVDLEARDESIARELIAAARTVTRETMTLWTTSLSAARWETLASEGFRAQARVPVTEYQPTLLLRHLSGVASRPGSDSAGFFDLTAWDLRVLYGDGV